MGLVLSTILPLVSAATSAVALAIVLQPRNPNPTIAEIEARNHAEKLRAEAECRENEAKELLERIQCEAEEERERAQALQNEANRAVARACEEVEKIRMEMAKAKEHALKAQAEAEVAVSATREDAANLQKQAETEREKARQAEEEAKRVEAAAREEAERVRQGAEEERRRAQLAQAEAERATAVAAEEARKAIVAREQVEMRWKKGIRPIVMPSADDVERAKEHVQYQEDFFHLAIAGVGGSGKSSLVNAFRGLRNRDVEAAAVDVTETTLEIARYPDPDPQRRLIWFDIPGAGTLNVPDWRYFNDHGLYVFDCIIVLIDARFTVTDIAILSNARRFNVPTYIVRSKADQNIRNIMRDMGYDSDEDEEGNPGRRNKLYQAARKQYIEKTRESVRITLEDANLPDQRVYLVSNDTMLSCITTQKPPKKVIDEIELLGDVIGQAVSRRGLVLK